MKRMQQFRNSFYFLLSLMLHVLLCCLLFLNMNPSSPPPIVNKGNTLVHATAIENTQVTALVKKLKDEQRQSQQAAIAKQKQLEDEARQAQQQRIAEQEKLATLQRQHAVEVKKVQQQKIDDAKAMQALKAQQALEQERLTQLQQQQKAAIEKLKKTKEQQAANQLAVEKAAEAEKRKQQQASEAIKLKQKQQYEAAAALQKKIAAKQAEISQQHAQAINGIVDQYKGLILEVISKNWLLPAATDPSLACQLMITLQASGRVINVQVIKGSGYALLDQSAVAAVYKASPLPLPKDVDAAAVFKQFSLTLRPEQFIEV